MLRREFLKIGALAAATIPFIGGSDSEAADVQIFVRNIEQSIDTHRFNQSAHLYINQFYQPSPMIWVWTPHGWTIQAQPVYYRSNLSFHGHLQDTNSWFKGVITSNKFQYTTLTVFIF